MHFTFNLSRKESMNDETFLKRGPKGERGRGGVAGYPGPKGLDGISGEPGAININLTYE